MVENEVKLQLTQPTPVSSTCNDMLAPDYSLSVTTNLEAFPSLNDLDENYVQIFKMIECKDHEGVERFLAERGHEVEMVPKVGCSALHHSKFNVANWENDFGDSPLILASKVDYRMVSIVLKFGGNPNHANMDGESPLSIAAVREDRESIKLLLLAAANLTAAVIKLTSSMRFKTHGCNGTQDCESGFSVKSLSLLLTDDVFLRCRDPIRTAFDVSRKIEEIVEVRDEFKVDLELLIRDADVFSYRLLDQCDKMWEARQVLDKSYGLLKKAIDERKKRFVAHAFSQQIIQEDWQGELTYKVLFGKVKIWIRFVLSPVVLPLFLLQYLFIDRFRKVALLDSNAARHMRLLFTPVLCFATDMMNYFVLLGLLLVTCLLPQTTPTPDPVEVVLWVSVLSRILVELDQMHQQGLWRYFSNFWNFIDVTTCTILTVSAIYKMSVWGIYAGKVLTTPDELQMKYHLLYITYLYGFAEFVLIMRWLNLLEVTTGFGPLLIALRYMLLDVFKFVTVILLTCVVGATIAVYSIINNIQELDFSAQNVTIPDEFNGVQTLITSIAWTTFGLLEMPGVDVVNDSTSTTVIHVLVLVYVLVACVMMLNMLIAMLNNTYEKIQENCDIEWKYARSELLKEYRNGQPFMFPFHFLMLPVTAWFRVSLSQEKKRMLDEEREKERNALFDKLGERYLTMRNLNCNFNDMDKLQGWKHLSFMRR